MKRNYLENRIREKDHACNFKIEKTVPRLRASMVYVLVTKD